MPVDMAVEAGGLKLGAHGLEPPILDLEMHSLHWGLHTGGLQAGGLQAACLQA